MIQMLLRTHYVFSTGILTFLGSLITRDPFSTLIFAGIVSVLANSLIDRLGHEMVWIEGKHLPRRTPLTHTWFRSILWGSLVTAAVTLLAYFALNSTYYHYSYLQLRELFSLAVIYGVLVGPTHMFLDVFTERGIYVKRNGRWVRIRPGPLQVQRSPRQRPGQYWAGLYCCSRPSGTI
jgi:Protein of unknown function (DUF1286).